MTATLDSDLETAHAAWHRSVEQRRTAPHGPLSTTSLEWLRPGEQLLDHVPGAWSLHPDGRISVHFTLADGVADENLEPVQAVVLGPFARNEGALLAWRGCRIDVAERGGEIAMRVRDPDSKDRRDYRGTETFPPLSRWVITGRFLPASRQEVLVDTAVSGSQQGYSSPGVVEFEIEGEPHRLTLFPGAGARRARALFADGTSGERTHPSGRSVEVVLGEDGAAMIDFTRATNPPCAYSDNATCPFPPPENRLAVRIEAGELRPRIPS